MWKDYSTSCITQCACSRGNGILGIPLMTQLYRMRERVTRNCIQESV